ncbi:hypothetical protein [Planomonospora parontospora]|uniref:hypothetical protein n=1 Tax=Planomonospora parontospora TaxID=58119 RepID=UPI00166FF11B|nr:hypothetical protein [Planomonospora parontospora]GGL42465.1 hypothetical protein GCM10014719_49740 [Planomonospora parontospora subsp. antibiotica]GII18387.1 hypothetical protein Ppa05_51130 [Planomonospora parontospora subsp. antibiotica]
MQARNAVDVAHIRELWLYGTGSALMWNGTSTVIRPCAAGNDGKLLEIATYEDIQNLRKFRVEAGLPSNDEAITYDLADILGDYERSWEKIKELMPLTVPYTKALAAHGFRRWGQGDGTVGPKFTQRYGVGNSRDFTITVSATPDAPVIIERDIRDTDGRLVRTVPVATAPRDMPPAEVAALIAAAAQTPPTGPADAPMTA